MLPEDQIKGIKEQLIAQIDSTFPDDKKASAISQIESMDAEQLEQFLIQNNLINADGSSEGTEGKCIFCSLILGEIPSTKIGENEKAIAILELNPISKGHTIIIPKDHVEGKDNLVKEVFDLAKETAERIKKKFEAKDILIENGSMFGHEIINVLPVYDNETLQSPKKQSTPEELAKIKDELENTIFIEEKTEEVEEKPQEEINEENTWLPKRIP